MSHRRHLGLEGVVYRIEAQMRSIELLLSGRCLVIVLLKSNVIELNQRR